MESFLFVLSLIGVALASHLFIKKMERINEQETA